jgi:manganese/zinc/iron transport system permease protein
MSPGDLLHGLLFDYTLRTVALGTAALGAVAGALGCFAVLRRQSLLGDAIAHAALPGIGLAFLLTGSRASLILLLGAAFAGWIGTLAILGILRTARLSEDTALGIVLSVFFGAGLVILTFVQRRPTAAQAGLETFLFGQAATLLARDVQVIAGLGAAALLLLLLFWKEFKLLTFDPDFAASLGLPVGRLDVFLTSLLVVAIVLGLQAVGVVLMSALVVAPAAAARQWTDSLSRMVVLAAVLGAGAGVAGASVSSLGRGIPTGPTVVLVASAFVAVSLLAAPGRGLAAEWIRTRRTRTRIRADSVLADLFALGAQHPDPRHPHDPGALQAMDPEGRDVEPSLHLLEARGWARRTDDGRWALTVEGADRARALFKTGSPPEEEA